MLEFKKLCDFCKSLSMTEKMRFIKERSESVIETLHSLDRPEIDPEPVLAGFILSAAVADGRIDEKEYLMIYPALIRTFGKDFDLSSVKISFGCDGRCKKAITAYTEDLIDILRALDEKTKSDIIILCLCVTAIDDKISYKEKRYIRHLCKKL